MMGEDNLVFGLLDVSAAICDSRVAAKYRDLTISWSRYVYRGPIIERQSVDEILAEANTLGYRYCFIQSYGHIIRERWTPERSGDDNFLSALKLWIVENEFFVVGHILREENGWFGLDPRCLLVDLERYVSLEKPAFAHCGTGAIELPRPNVQQDQGITSELVPSGEVTVAEPSAPGWNFVANSLSNGIPVLGLAKVFVDHSLFLDPEDADRTVAFSKFLDDGISEYRSTDQETNLGSDQTTFLGDVDRQTSSSRQGVFLWNVEPYTDIETPPEGFTGPVSTLYSVAAGFKPNRILETHGYDDNTTVVFFDYSKRALDIRKDIVENWNGEDFPNFVRYLVEKYPKSDTLYQLWEGLSSHERQWKDVERRWEGELERWGGEQVFKSHWQNYRSLRHEYLHCNILADSSKLFEIMGDEKSSIIWFSNAFFTMYANWHYTAEQRKQLYDRWIERIADSNPYLFLYGSDYNNINVNYVQAGKYWELYRDFGENYLVPYKVNRYEIRM
ncbi:MAG: hypothetical protein OEU36_23885 [Gammaproteobacteria bacterium]|nr:hypothetical protein [Gammaproteobacteria bacterium]